MQDADKTDPTEITLSPFARHALFALGWVFVALGAVGAVLPVIPTVPFLLVAAWAFAKSSKRWHAWLYSHPHYGPYLIAWDKYGVIPVSAKVLSVVMMSGGWLFATLFVAETWRLPLILGVIHVAVATYIVTRPSRPPTPE
ncbi:MAG: YbaN family protein [Alphaproteobacteria bacterium]